MGRVRRSGSPTRAAPRRSSRTEIKYKPLTRLTRNHRPGPVAFHREQTGSNERHRAAPATSPSPFYCTSAAPDRLASRALPDRLRPRPADLRPGRLPGTSTRSRHGRTRSSATRSTRRPASTSFWATTVPGLSFLFAPLTAIFFGPAVSYNVAAILRPGRLRLDRIPPVPPPDAVALALARRRLPLRPSRSYMLGQQGGPPSHDGGLPAAPHRAHDRPLPLEGESWAGEDSHGV